jgi:putative thiamine transport system substrate-binding protein
MSLRLPSLPVAALAAVTIAALCLPARAADPDPANWPAVQAAAKGQTVYFNAWGGEPRINAYIAWAGTELEKRFGVTVVHVKLEDTGTAVSRVLAEKTAGNNAEGSVDLIWINGKNFAAMKSSGLLQGGMWAEKLPSFALTDPEKNPGVRSDFTVPVEGQEAPWGKAQLVFSYDTAEVKEPPRSMPALLAWAKANPGRFTYPLPPDFTGSTFLKQALLDIIPSRTPLSEPVAGADFQQVTAPLWAFLDALHPSLWRQGRTFPANSADLRRLLADDETSIAFAFNPADASAGIASGELPKTVRTFVLDKGTIGNLHFLAVPYNAKGKAGAMVLADFLLSPEAQAHKQDPKVWGDFSVLSMAKLSAADKASFDGLDLGVATLKLAELGSPVPEPHPSWMEAIEKEWAKRYSGK